MSLLGALNIGRSALAAQQAAIQVTGNNVANAGDPNYTRQVPTLTPTPDQQIHPGMFIGTGVDITEVSRQIDSALESRLRGSVSDNASASTNADRLGRQIARLTGGIAVARGGTAGTANSLLDQRDADLKQLSQLLDVQTVEQRDGTVNVYSGSEPLIIGTENQGIAVKQTSADG